MSINYRVSIERLAGGWTETIVKGTKPAATARRVVRDGLTYRWQFTDDRAPGPLEPSVLSLAIACRTKDDLPPLELGDLFRFRIVLTNTSGGTLATLLDTVMRLGEPEVELMPTARKWKVTAKLSFTDLLADLRSRFPQPGMWREGSSWNNPSSWCDQYAEERAHLNLWYITEWPQDEFIGLLMQLKGDELPDESAYNQLARLAASWPTEAGHLCALRPRYSTAAPTINGWTAAGFRKYGIEDFGAYPDPAEPIGYIFQKIDRELPANSHLPLRLTGSAGGPVSTLEDTVPGSIAGVAAVRSRHAIIPANARRARDQQVNTHVISGLELTTKTNTNGDQLTEFSESTLTVTTNPRNPRTRSVETMNILRHTNRSGVPEDRFIPAGAPGYSERNAYTRGRFTRGYVVDESASAAEWVYDGLTVRSHEMTETEARRLLPMFIPASPTATTDVLLRQVLVTDVPADVDLTGHGTIAGLLVGATLTLSGGDFTIESTLSPGTLPPAVNSGALTVAQLAAGPYANTPASSFDASVTALTSRLTRS